MGDKPRVLKDVKLVSYGPADPRPAKAAEIYAELTGEPDEASGTVEPPAPPRQVPVVIERVLHGMTDAPD